MNKEFYLCIHGHFYQPPRENAWTEEVEVQPSAFPFHDWNERINYECYHPNSTARVLDNYGLVKDIVNNFEKINFNFGPTLFSWLEKKDPITYKRILESDKKSVIENSGHGNAIAQIYNHIIMPLANRRDKITQVKWGLKDFRYRFGRNPESIWLSETACNEETIEVLIEEGIKYIILAPLQAESIKSFNSNDWIDVSDGQIDITTPYRCYLKNKKEKFIDIFFYNGQLARAISFEDPLLDAKHIMSRVEHYIDSSKSHSQIISIATDGENYGHHKIYGDRALAYLTFVEAKEKGIKTINYGKYLSRHSPNYEVKLKEGKNGEGTSWSCVHGVDRWQDNCGCKTSGDPGWNQEWRKPLRIAFNYLRDELSTIFEKYGEKYFTNVWDVRNNYIDVILNRSEKNSLHFIEKHSKVKLEKSDIIICLKLLEMQRHAMLMYTSCAWFFSELSGIETVQVIQYAARAIELAKDIGIHFKDDFSQIEEKFLSLLSEAKSNIPEYKDGKNIYYRFVQPSFASIEKIAASQAIKLALMQTEKKFGLDNFKIEVVSNRKESHGVSTINFGRIKILSLITLEEKDFVFVVLQFGNYDFRCSLKDYSKSDSTLEFEKDLFNSLYNIHQIELERKIDDFFGKEFYSLKSLFLEDRTKILSNLTRETINKVGQMYESAYEENKNINEFFNLVNIPMPEEMKFISEFALNKRLHSEIANLSEHRYDLKTALELFKVFDLAKNSNIKLKLDELRLNLSNSLTVKVKSLESKINIEVIKECINIIKISKRININLNIGDAQVILFNILKNWKNKPLNYLNINNVPRNNIFKLARCLYLNPVTVKNFLKRSSNDKLINLIPGEN